MFSGTLGRDIAVFLGRGRGGVVLIGRSMSGIDR